MEQLLNQHIEDAIEKINPLLADLDPDTQGTVIMLLAYTQYDIDGHEDTSKMLSAFVSCLTSVTTPQADDNPYIVSAHRVAGIWAVVHGQAQQLAHRSVMHIEDAVKIITDGVLNALQFRYQDVA